MEQTRICNICEEEKILSAFEWQKNRPNPRKTCKLCRGRKQWNDIKNDPQRHKEVLLQRRLQKYTNARGLKNSVLKTKYGIDHVDYDKMLELQNHCCFICKESFSCSLHTHVDHDHITNEVRGLLCQQCNMGLGAFRDNPEYLKNAIDYLK